MIEKSASHPRPAGQNCVGYLRCLTQLWVELLDPVHDRLGAARFWESIASGIIRLFAHIDELDRTLFDVRGKTL